MSKFATTADNLKTAFEQAGISVFNVVVPKGAPDKNRGYAFLEVADGKTAMEALDAELVIDGRRVVLNEAHQPKAERLKGSASFRTAVADVSTRLYVGNLSLTATEASVRNLFETHGLRPLDVYRGFDRQTQRAKDSRSCR